MKSLTLRLARGVAIVVTLGIASACGLPSAGPSKSQIFSGSVEQEGDAFVLPVDDRVNSIATLTPQHGFSAAFQDAQPVGSDTIAPGDVLSLTIWENVDDGLIVPRGQNATALDQVQVDGNGFIFVPYVGRVLAAGNTPETIRRIISERLSDQTPDPQVEVRRLAGDGATVAISGAVSQQGVFPIERPTRTLSAMLAKAGGVAIDPEVAQITVIRGSQSGSIWFEDLYDHPGHDIALRSGDRIFVEQDTRSFTALGQTGGQSEVPFNKQAISAIEALAQAGGLSSVRSDATGIFVFRDEPQEIANRLLNRTDLVGPQRVIYVMDLTEPNGVFMARDFAIRDKDTVYVTEAPYSQFAKIIAAFTGSLGAITTLDSTVSGL